jgi:deazaflavin-dependent oxidoreductase (nitroreductase family)
MRSYEPVKEYPATALHWPFRILGILLLVVLAPFLLVLLVTFLAVIFVTALREFTAFRERVRQFNKRTLNPAVLTFAGHSGKPYAVIHHVGRRAGHPYATPVVADPTPDGFLIPLPYGADTDWCRNVLVAGQTTLEREGNEYTVTEPEVIDAAIAWPMLPPANRRAFQMLGIKQFLKVRCLSAAHRAAAA